MIPVVVIGALAAAVLLYDPSCKYVFEAGRRIMAVRDEPAPKMFAKRDYEIRMKWEGTILGGKCKTQMVFSKPPAELYESIDAGIGKMGRVVFLDEEDYQVMVDDCDREFFTIEIIDAAEALVYRHNFPCSAADYNKVCDARYSLDSAVGKVRSFRK